jgi:hypothetical protein
MTPPAHSIETPPGRVGGDLYASRNNFLYLLLGLISTAEQMLSAIPDIAAVRRDDPTHPPTEDVAPNRILR